ncbi:ribokinase [Pseudogracilibacillus auburnensis]|uniref:ribokinase n=1 Tax=Pseudogracilibacillus auburnensis TaxID=1494959 RepID=UPI001A9696D9|nr:ribokinase [Pseudogracilibacillus auburnensis]MBO1005659.1 ribokinase [Pseudogracilibacillus auburnensis]
MSTILVAGSMNIDIVTKVNRHPLPGETIHGMETSLFPGGKGANQAVAAARLGASVCMVGAVGNDLFGNEIKRILSDDGIDLTHVKEKNSTTGMALITIDQTGENNIILSQGANGLITKEDISRVSYDRFDAILLQNEIPWEANAFVLEKAQHHQVKTVFNPAPALAISKDYLSLIDILILNEHEATEMTQCKCDTEEDIVRSAQFLIDCGVKEVIITLGKKGSFYMNNKQKVYSTAALQVPVVDTTAAGDTFIGAFIAKYMSGHSVEKSLDYASVAAAISVTIEGAQNSIPNVDKVNNFMQRKEESM